MGSGALGSIPKDEKGEPIYEQAEPATAWQAILEQAEGDADMAAGVVDSMIADKEAAVKKAEKAKPKHADTIAGKIAAEKERKAAVERAKAELEAWKKIAAAKDEHAEAAKTQKAEEAKKQEQERHAAAVAQAEQDKAAQQRKEEEQQAVGTHAVSPKIKQKWDEANKIEGNANVITLPDGSQLRGHYVLTEAGAATASHDAENGFEPTEGFPVDENGQSVNDRDYSRDKDAQRMVGEMADNYDSRAVQSPVIVSQDGVVLSGNNRTMSGDIAAKQGTDKAYVDHLKEFGKMYGFTPEQIEAMKHPRVVFVPDEPLPYDAATFARFNAETQKRQSKPEAAVKLGKTVPDEVFSGIATTIGGYDKLSDFYADSNAVNEVLKRLLDAGVINEMQLPELRTGNALSAAGKELIENMLIGKAFQSAPDAVRQLIAEPNVKQAVVMALSEIAHNRTLEKSGYGLGQELAAAIDLVYRARRSNPDMYKNGVPVSPFGRQLGLFDEQGDQAVTDGAVLLLADILSSGKTSDLRKVLAAYNAEATESASGQADIFSGKVASKEEILKTVTEHFKNATRGEQKKLVDAAVGKRKQTAAELGGRGKEGEQTENADERSEKGGSRKPAGGERPNSGGNPERQGDLAETYGITLSDKTDENGLHYIQTAGGGLSFGEVDDASGLTAAPMYLSEGMITNPKTNDGYGFIHIDKKHGDEIRKAGFKSTMEFIKTVAKNYEVIREGNLRDGRQTYRLLLTDNHNNTLMIELASDGTHWDINTGGVFKLTYGKGKKEVYNRHTTAKQSAETAETSQGAEQSGTQASSRMNVSTSPGSKDSASGANAQEGGGNSAVAVKEKPRTKPKKDDDDDGPDGPTGGAAGGKGGEGKSDESGGSAKAGPYQRLRGLIHDLNVKFSKGEDTKGVEAEIADALKEMQNEALGSLMEQIKASTQTSAMKSLANLVGLEYDRRSEKAVDAITGNAAYAIFPATYTNKKGKKTVMSLLKFDHALTPEQERAIKEFASEKTREGRFAPARGWKDRESGGWMFRSEEDARKAAEMAGNKEAVADNQPLTAQELREAVSDTKPEKKEEPKEAGKTLLYHRGPVVAESNEAEQALLEVVNEAVKGSGIEVLTDVDEGQKVLDAANGKDVRLEAKKRRALETASLGEEPRSLTVVSSADGAKVLNNIDTLATELEESATQPKTFIGDVAKALGAARHGSSSEYATFETKNGKVVTIRLANHSAKVSNFDKNGEDEGISIVVSPKPNSGVENDGNAHVVEYYYDAIKLRRAEGKPLAEIVRSIKQALYSGEFKDTTGLAERQEVNGEEVARMQKVYHGSGADFDEFDHSHMGEGEGAQAYGWGAYVTGVEDIGRHYAQIGFLSAEARRKGNGDPKFLAVHEIINQETFNSDAATYEQRKSAAVEDVKRTIASFEKMLKNQTDEKYLTFLRDSLASYKATLDELMPMTEEQYNEERSRQGRMRHLYTVEIPDDTGENYIDYNGKISDIPSQKIDAICTELEKLGWKRKDLPSMVRLTDGYGNIVLNPDATGADLYEEIKVALKSPKLASELLSRAGFAGIKYPAEYMSGGRADHAKDYVIFNEKDARITDHVRFFRTPGGEAYGFTVGGKIYVDPRIATADTPIHEYTHLWGDMMRRVNPKAWGDIVRLMKGKGGLWNWVKEKYPELETDDQIADEVLAQFSGKRGAERLREEMRKAAEGSGSITEKAKAISALQRVKEAIGRFWRGVAELLHIRFTTAEEVADRVMADLLHGVDPRKVMDDSRYNEFAEKHKVDANEVKDYATAIKEGNLMAANRALSEIRRTLRVAHREMNLFEFGKFFRPINQELAERFGDIEKLRQEHIAAAEREHNAMEAARKKAEEEEAKKRKRQEELSMLTADEIDKRYAEALERGDEAAAREMLDEAARRNGYGDTESDYQGVGAWVAPSNPGYESDEARRADVENNAPDVNLEDMALGYNLQPDDYFTHPERYSQDTPHGRESTQAIHAALEALKRGDKDVKAKVYRAVPASVKEGRLRNGDWVTPSKKYAEMHGNSRLEGKYRIIEDEVPAKDLWWDGNDANEFGYDDGRGYKYKNTKNNRKLNDLVTRDDKGNIIPPSKRFNQRKSDVRYSLREGSAHLGRGGDDEGKEFSLRDKAKKGYDPRANIAPVRGEWTKDKIIKRLKDMGGARTGYSFAAKLISEFDSPEELADHMYYHGTARGGGSLKPSILFNDRDLDSYGGGGYGERYWGVSLSKSKRVSSNFSGTSRSVSIYPVILAKNAKVKDMPQLTDASELDDVIVDLWKDGVDAVRIGDWNDKGSEQELCVINPRAIVNIDNADYYKVFGLGTDKNPLHIIDKAGIEKLYDDAKRFEAQKGKQPRKPLKPSRFDDDFELKPDGQYQKEMEEYQRKLAEYENSQELADWEKAKSEARDNIRFRLLDDDDPQAQELESLGDGELVPVYRNVQVFDDDSLGSPMAFSDAVTGERRRLEGGKWNYSEPREVKLTPEQQRQLDELNRNGYLTVDGKKTTELPISKSLKFVKPKNGDATLQYHLKKSPEDSGLWAAYNPYDHAVETPLNTQFAEAYKRPNLVVVRSLVPKSELEGHYKAPYAKDSTGAHKWNNGRTLYLSRYSKIDKVLTREEEAKLIDEYWKKNPGKREALASHRDYRRFVPEVRKALEKMGYRFELDGKELTPEEAQELDRQQVNAEPAIPGEEGRVPRVGPEDIARINAKMSGKWVGEPKETMAQSMVRRVKELAAKLGVKVRIVTSADELAKSPSRRQRKMKGMYDIRTGEVIIVIGNHENLADVENTVLHEVVGHRGFRILFKTKEAFDHAMDELYRVSSEKIRKWIDDKARKLYDDEVDRIMASKKKERSARGEDPSEHHLEDMMAAHIEASKKKDQFRREATEEYGAHLAGRIGEKGFEKMSAEEQTFWGRLKSMLQKALQRLAEGLNITGKHEWTNKDWAYVLHEAYKREKNGGKPSIFDEADTIAMRMRTGFGEGKEERKSEETKRQRVKDKITELFEKAKTGIFSGKPQRIGRLSPKGKAFLERLSGLKLKQYVDFVLNPSDLRHIRSDHYGENEKDKGNNVPLTDEDIRNMVDVLSEPDGILYGIDSKDGRKLFFFLKKAENGLYNLTEVCSTRNGNLTAKSFFKSKKKGISQRVMEIEKSLLPTSSTYSGESLSSGTKIPTLFDFDDVLEENVSDEGKMFRDVESNSKCKVTESVGRISF